MSKWIVVEGVAPSHRIPGAGITIPATRVWAVVEEGSTWGAKGHRFSTRYDWRSEAEARRAADQLNCGDYSHVGRDNRKRKP